MGYGRFSAERFCLPFLVVRAALAGPVGRFAALSMTPSQSGDPIFPESTSDIDSINSGGRSLVPKPFDHEAVAGFWQENVGNSDSRISGHRVDGAPARRLRRGQGDRRGVAGAARRWTLSGLARQRDRHHAPDRRRHAVEIQGDEPGRVCGEFYRVLTAYEYKGTFAWENLSRISCLSGFALSSFLIRLIHGYKLEHDPPRRQT
jgi:hypothetical protein